VARHRHPRAGYRTGGYLAGPGSVVDGIAYVVEHSDPAMVTSTTASPT
jgi:hypothetical protein